ncbi:hypothetical protein CDL15_Pgr014586 [Punica granatum]|uniref:Uncharacterized protein n=1 Tax=Punica granatum TaxID=22663 RepID=A0A218WEE2_PUNGR|nr:hypothetical protein CDL15_Pgr014586 [Punica granatum]
MVGGEVSSCLIPNGPSCLVVITWQDQAVPKSTSPGHSPWILGAKIPSPLTPGYSPETGDSTGLNDPNPDHP